MGKIAVLPDDVVDHIAAGEVVERPASALKELLENALDAGARRIRIDVAEDASDLMVSDDGDGMEPDDAELCFLRHATSKLRRREDLECVATLGFRGEALAAIAAVSELEILTRARGRSEGYRVRVVGGQRVAAGPAAAPEGTTVWVRRLFFNTPARRRYLKSPSAERRACLEAAARVALGHPRVAFEASTAGQRRWSTPGGGDLRAAAAAVIGPEEAASLLPLEAARGPVRVWGLTSPPDLTRPNREHLWVFVNGRWVQDRTVAAAVVRGYESRLGAGRFPVALVHLEVDPGWVDVNVHPAKLYVRFRDDHLVFSVVASAVRAALGRAPAYPLARRPGPGGVPSGPPRPGARPGALAQVVPEPAGPPDAGVPGPVGAEGPGAAEVAATLWPEPAAPIEPLADQLRSPQLLGQLHRTYVVAQAPGGLVLVDQHVAHERLVFERLLAALRGGPSPAQQLLHPLPVELGSWRAAEALRGIAGWLARVGLELEPFGSRQVLVRTVPAAGGFPAPAEEGRVRELLEEVAEEAAEWPGVPGPEEQEPVSPWELRLLKRLACRSAVKAGTPLGRSAMERLLRDLSLSDNPYTCPHGRPVAVLVSLEELDRRFGRRTPR